MADTPLHRRYPRMWTAYHALCARLSIEPIPGDVLDRALLQNEFVRMYDLAQACEIDVSDIIEEAVR